MSSCSGRHIFILWIRKREEMICFLFVRGWWWNEQKKACPFDWVALLQRIAMPWSTCVLCVLFQKKVEYNALVHEWCAPYYVHQIFDFFSWFIHDNDTNDRDQNDGFWCLFNFLLPFWIIPQRKKWYQGTPTAIPFNRNEESSSREKKFSQFNSIKIETNFLILFSVQPQESLYLAFVWSNSCIAFMSHDCTKVNAKYRSKPVHFYELYKE